MEGKLPIKANLYYITQYTSSTSRLMTLLIQDDLLTFPEKEEVESNVTYEARVEKLFFLLSKKNPDSSDKVLQNLRRTGNGHVADKLSGVGTIKTSKKRPEIPTSTFKKGSNDSGDRCTTDNSQPVIALEGESGKYESFENVMGEISPELEYLSLKYVFSTPKHLLKTFEFCEGLTTIILHNVNIAGMFSRKVEMKALEVFDYRDDGDVNDIKNMEIDERLQFLQQLLFFIPKKDLKILQRSQVKITVCIADYDYVNISGPESINPFVSLEYQKEDIAIIDNEFSEVLDRKDSLFQETKYSINGHVIDKQKFLNMVQNNGEFVNSIKLHDTVLEKDTLLEYLRKCPNLIELRIEKCPIDGNFAIHDRILLKDLRVFSLTINDDELGNDVRKISEKYAAITPAIFCFYKTEPECEIDQIWDQQVEIRLKINSQVMMDLKSGKDVKILLGNTNDDFTTSIFNGVSENVNRIYLNSLSFPKPVKLGLLKSNLTHFVLRYVCMPNISEFIRDCYNLAVLVIYEANTESIFFSRDLGKLRRLRKLSLNNATFKFPLDDTKWESLEDLHLYHCYCSTAPNKIYKNFPALKHFTLDSRLYGNSLLLKDLLRLEDSLLSIAIWRFHWVVDSADDELVNATNEMKAFFRKFLNCDVDDNQKRFILNKVDSDLDQVFKSEKGNHWQVSFPNEWNGDEWREQEFSDFVFSQFFSS